jgi:hypothetical protein
MIGGHYVPGGEFLLPIMEQLDKAGRWHPFMLLMRQKYGSELTPTQVKLRSPHTKICQRWYYENVWRPALPDMNNPNCYQAGFNFCNAYFDQLPVDSQLADWHQILNEPSSPVTGLGTASFWMGAGDAAYRRGYHISFLNTSNTWPALPGEREGDGSLKQDHQFWLRADTIQMVRQCKAQGHIILTHEYVIPDNPPWNPALWAKGYGMSRYDIAVSLLPADCKDVMWALGEWGTGIGSTIGGQIMKDCWRYGDAAFHASSVNMVGVGGWCWGPWNEQGRPSSDIGYHRDDARDYWTTARF